LFDPHTERPTMNFLVMALLVKHLNDLLLQKVNTSFISFYVLTRWFLDAMTLRQLRSCIT